MATGKAKLKRLQESEYKRELVLSRTERSPELEREVSFLESILDKMALATTARVPRPTARRDQLFLYLKEDPISNIRVIEYQRSQEADQPQLTSIAFDFLAIPAISSKCERVFSSCVKQTTPESSRLSGLMLQYQECLKNW